VKSAESARPIRHCLRFAGAAVDFACDDEGARRWLAETVAPWFALDGAASEPPPVWLRSCASRFAELEARRGTASLVEVPCFELDRSLATCPGWTEPDGATIAHDALFGCHFVFHPQQIEVVGTPGNRRARMGLFRVVRELATLRAEIQPQLDLHAAGLVWADRAVLLVGEKCSGKTTLLAHALASGAAAMLANDRVIVSRDRAFGVPTMVSVREDTRRFFPRLADGLPERPYLRTAEELAGAPPHRPRTGELFVLAPGQLASQLGSAAVASARLGAIVFPEVKPEREGWSIERLSPAEGATRLDACGYGRRTGPRDATWLRRLVRDDTGGRRSDPDRSVAPSIPDSSPDSYPDPCSPRALAQRFPMVRIVLGRRAYDESALGWLSALPIAAEGAA